MRKRIKAIGIMTVSLILTVLIFSFYVRTSPQSFYHAIFDTLIGLFLLILFSASLIYWTYYGFRKYILRKREKEFGPTERIRDVARRQRQVH